MASKFVTDRQKSALAIRAAAETHGPEIARVLIQEMTPYLQEGETLPDGRFLGVLLGRVLQASAKVMVQADEAHQAELQDDVGPRSRRDEASAALSDVLVSLRNSVRGLFGARAEVSILGIEGVTATDPVVLLRQADTALVKLRDPRLSLPEPKIVGVAVNPAQWVDLLEGPANLLRAALEEVASELREAEQTQMAKNAALAAYDQHFSRAAGLLQALLRYASLDELADKVRPSTKRPGVTAEMSPSSP